MSGAMDAYPRRKRTWPSMLIKRILVILVLLPVGLVLIYFGGWWYTALIALFIGFASWEFVKLYSAGGLRPVEQCRRPRKFFLFYKFGYDNLRRSYVDRLLAGANARAGRKRGAGIV